MSLEDKEFVGELRNIPLTAKEISKYLNTSRQALYQGIAREKRYFTIEKLRGLRKKIENDAATLSAFERTARHCFEDMDIAFGDYITSADLISQGENSFGEFWIFVKDFRELANHRRVIFENITNKMTHPGNKVVFFTCSKKYEIDPQELQRIVDIYYLIDFDSSDQILSTIEWRTNALAVEYMPLMIIYFTSKGPRAAVALEDRFIDLPESDTRELMYTWRLFYEANKPGAVAGNGARPQSGASA